MNEEIELNIYDRVVRQFPMSAVHEIVHISREISAVTRAHWSQFGVKWKKPRKLKVDSVSRETEKAVHKLYEE